VSSSLAEINVVPLVDVMLVLLVIFMVSAPMMQQAITVNLPESRRAAAESTTLVRLTIPATFPADGRVQLNGQAMGLDVLGERLRQEIDLESSRALTVEVEGTLTFNDWARVHDRLVEVGVTRADLLTQQPAPR
jgi:biopolymer transport protein ExbD